jgi:hypothetical protein
MLLTNPADLQYWNQLCLTAQKKRLIRIRTNPNQRGFQIMLEPTGQPRLLQPLP